MKSIPSILLNQLGTVKAFDENTFIAAHQQAPVTSVRLHPLKPSESFEGTSKVPWCTEGRYLNERPVFTLDPSYHAGAYYVQEASSMFLDHMVRALLPERKNLRVLDLCGAPGGKSTLLASLLDPSSLLISNEVIRSRATILEENVVRWGYTNNWVTSNDPKDFGKLRGYFDLIVIDAPCSGSGLFRKDANALADWTEANVLLCSQRQQRIIADIWPSLNDDGILIYATCSYSPEEDEHILDWLNREFSVESLPVTFPEEWGIVTVETSDHMTGYRFFPDKLKGEGFFIAAIQKKEEEDTIRFPRFKTSNDTKAQAQSSHLMSRDDLVVFPASKDFFHAIAADHEADWHVLNHALYFRKVGRALGMPTAKEWVPAHDIALSIDRSESIPALELTKEQALKFLKREDMIITLEQKGWLLVTYNGLGLGWVKSLGNRFNNYLPKHWRIRMDLD